VAALGCSCNYILHTQVGRNVPRYISRDVAQARRNSRQPRRSCNPHKNPFRGKCIVQMYDSLLHWHKRNRHKSRYPSRCILPKCGSYY